MDNGKQSKKAAKRKAKRAATRLALQAHVSKQVAAAERAAAGASVGALKSVARLAARTAGAAARKRGTPGKRDRGVIRPVARRVNVDAIAESLMAPRQFYPERMALEIGSAIPTAVCHPHEQMNAPWDASNPASAANDQEVYQAMRAAKSYVGSKRDVSGGPNPSKVTRQPNLKADKLTVAPLPELKPGEMFALVTRKPQCAVIMKQNNGAHYNYDLWLTAESRGSPPTVPAIDAATTAVNGNVYPVFGTPNPSDLTATPIHGNIWYGASLNGEQNDQFVGCPSRYFFLEQGAVMAFTTTTSTNATVYIGYCDGKVVDANIDFIQWTATTGGTYNVPKTGYWTFNIEADTAAVYKASVGGGGAGVTTFAHRAIKNLVDNQSSAEAVRVSAAALQYTNTAPLLDLQGKIAQYQYPAGTAWIDVLVNQGSAYDAVSSEQNAWTSTAKKGSYAFLKPANYNDFKLQTFVHIDENNNLVDSYWPIMDDSSFVCSVISIDEPSGRGGYFEFSFGLEYQTTDVWRDTEVPQASPEEYKVALETLRVLDQYYCNPLHLSQILSGIKKVGSTLFGAVRKYGPAINGIVGDINPAAGKIGGAVLKGLDAFANEAGF